MFRYVTRVVLSRTHAGSRVLKSVTPWMGCTGTSLSLAAKLAV